LEFTVSARALLIVIVGLAAVIEDLGWRRISNWTSGSALAGGLIVHYLQKGWSGAWHSLLGALIGFGVFLVFYLLGGMGGGDVKLMSGFGALLGDGRILTAALLAAASGGVMALGYLAVRGLYRRSKIWSGGAVKPGEDKPGEVKSGESIPYAPAITVGAWLALVSEM
jgi:prepilin peptidase CpaA